MALQVFSPPRMPSMGSSRSVTPRMLVAEFGDGYTQRTGDGLNSQPHTWSLVWNALLDSEVSQLDDFFQGLEPGEAFLWMPYGKPQAKYICTAYGQTWGEADQYTATFRQVFDL